MFSDLTPTSKKILLVFIAVISFTILEIGYYNFEYRNLSSTILQKKKAVSLTQLPDLAFVTETVWLRHRSITSLFSVFPEDGNLLDYYPSSFVYNLQLPNKSKQVNQYSNEEPRNEF